MKFPPRATIERIFLRAHRTDMENYRVNIDGDNFIEVASYMANDTVRVCNIRSVHGKLGDEEFNFLDDTKLKKLAMDYLRVTDNVELLNILSREMNGWNWYECYDGDYNVNYEPTKNELLNPSGNVNDEHPGRPGCSQIVDPRRFTPQVRSTRGKELLPNELKKYVHEGIRPETKIDISNINYVPIWHVNGSAKANADKCDLYAPFEVLIHLLAKRFIPFKSKLLQLTAVDIQLAVAKNETIDQYADFRKYQLREALKQKDDEITDLKKTINEMNTKMDRLQTDITSLRDQNTDLQTDLTTANAKLDVVTDQNTHLQIDLSAANDKLDELVESHREMRTAVVGLTTDLVNYTEVNLPANAITTGTTDEILVLLHRPALEKRIWEYVKVHLAGLKKEEKIDLSSDYMIIDTLVVKTSDLEKELTKHEYDESKDTLLFKSKCNNSMDLFKHYTQHVGIGREINIKNVCSRKVVCRRSDLQQLLTKIRQYAKRSLNVRQGWLDLMKANSTAIIERINEQIGEHIDAQISVLEEAINRNLNEIKEEVRSALQELRKLHPNAKQVFYNYYYRDLIIKDGEVYCKVYKESNRLHKLTPEEIVKLRFRR